MVRLRLIGFLLCASKVIAQPAPNSTLAERGAAFAALPDQRTGTEVLYSSAWDEISNPNGVINFGTAENAAMLDERARVVQEYKFQLKREHFNQTVGPWGSPRLRKALATHVNKYFKVHNTFNETEVTFATGVTAFFDLLGWSLFNTGDAILLGTPSYPGFANDFSKRAGVRPIFVSFNGTDQFTPESIPYYEAAIAQSSNEKFRAMVICNPHNPLGQSYPRETIIALMKFASKHKLHLIFDEVYALSTHTIPGEEGGASFSSAFSFDSSEYIDQKYIHLLYGTSKDFATFGLRLGALLTKNTELTRAVFNQVTYYWPGNALQEIGSLILEDEAGKEAFVAKSSETAARNSGRVRAVLDQAGVPYSRKANAGFFLWVDFGKFLPNVTGDQWAVERAFTQQLQRQNVFLSAGQGQRAPRAGFYRLCFSQPDAALKEGLRRLVRAIGKDEGIVDSVWGL